MGLDITYYRDCKRVGENKECEDWERGHHHVYSPYSGMEIRLDGAVPGCYVGTECGSFRAGSYSGYNEWRSELCHRALSSSPNEVWENEGKYAGKPFVELIAFSDCEGAIGPKTSAKLSKDFTSCRDLVCDGADEYFVEKYDDWASAFESAQHDGFVIFH
ncbi:hypothetical protein [Candidatus Magnetobacterium casense]|uniref:Uncharacterized protein n=1 Tax=Candidatus Magnetobacterium casense TaxID=1455061 RepID=A0ABS6S2R2_9BACT|nr:hypothetical protein [Candidatus Magnetobacterium casensis]MBV6343136.1 hypothetical protein [Candidatus Magnetobacterium casensis]